MGNKSKGPRRRTRHILKRGVRERTTITKYLQEFELGSRVVIKPTPSSHKGMPFKRFFGLSGIVIDKKGKSYIIKIKDGKKEKNIIVRPEHMKVV